MPRFRILLPALLTLALPARSQTTHEAGYWMRAYLRVQLAGRWAWHSELDERRLLAPGRQWQLVAHQHLHYRLRPRLDVGLGGSYARQPQPPGVALPEWRAFAEASLTTPLPAAWRLQHRLRLEQRWLAQPGAAEQPTAWAQRARLRYRLQAEWAARPGWKLRAANELLLHPDSFDQNRVYAGAERQLGAGFAAELGYLWLYQRRYHRPAYLDRHVLRFTLYKDLHFPHPAPQS